MAESSSAQEEEGSRLDSGSSLILSSSNDCSHHHHQMLIISTQQDLTSASGTSETSGSNNNSALNSNLDQIYCNSPSPALITPTGLPCLNPINISAGQQIWPSLNCLQVNVTCEGTSNRSGSSVTSSAAGSSAPAGMLTVPLEQRYRKSNQDPVIVSSDDPFDQDYDILKSCGAFESAVLGLMKSFSTSDLIDCDSFGLQRITRPSVSDPVLVNCAQQNYNYNSVKLLSASPSGYDFQNPQQPQNCGLNITGLNRPIGLASRSVSTWVAVGDPISNFNSQLPSPSTGGSAINVDIKSLFSISGADLVKSVNKKYRQLYIKKRLMNSYRALERLSKSQFDLTAAEFRSNYTGFTNCSSNNANNPNVPLVNQLILATSPSTLSMNTLLKTAVSPPSSPTVPKDGRSQSSFAYGPNNGNQQSAQSSFDSNPDNGVKLVIPQIIASDVEPNDGPSRPGTSSKSWIQKLKEDLSTNSMSVRDVNLSKGQPLSKYERNMMIFNWLQDLENTDDDLVLWSSSNAIDPSDNIPMAASTSTVPNPNPS